MFLSILILFCESQFSLSLARCEIELFFLCQVRKIGEIVTVIANSLNELNYRSVLIVSQR